VKLPFARATTPTQDVVLLVARLALGAVMIAHGWQKLDQGGLGGTADGFAAMGIPLAPAAAAFAIAVEIGGGALVLLGALTPLVGVLWALNMAGAWWFVHRDAFFVAEGGYELVLVLGVLGLVLACTGPGRVSVDRLLDRRVTGQRDEERQPEAVSA
jgi:putative oxidoreductase